MSKCKYKDKTLKPGKYIFCGWCGRRFYKLDTQKSVYCCKKCVAYARNRSLKC
ncbi:hypothetical protein ACWJXY_17640 [Clostridioides difficile]|nr:hypothetical protein [Clostridioides difficile]HBF7249300.1 hypothetical protein [Clostridioides difficile]